MKPLCFAVAVLLSLSTFLPPVHPRERCPLLHAPEGANKTGCYIVMMKEGTSMEKYESVIERVVGISEENKLYGSVRRVAMAFTVKLSDSALMEARAIPEIKFIEEETMAMATQSPIPWHLDRVDQAQLPLDGRYDTIWTGGGVDIYILDTGIRYEHEEYESRAKYSGYDPVDDEYNENRRGRDCEGHGSHVASLAGSKTFGSAKSVTLYSVRVLACNGFAPWSIVLDGLEHSLESILLRKRPAVVSMSLGGLYTQSVEDSVQRLHSFGITMVAAAGNEFYDACQNSPASSNYVITVGGTAIDDEVYSGTNHGSCVDLFAPGSSVRGVDYSCNSCTTLMTGTSMACPIVSGAAAILLEQDPSLTPDEVKQKLLEDAADDVINFRLLPINTRAITPNKLLQVSERPCGGVVSATRSGNIRSPGYPTSYPSNLYCEWTIIADTNQLATLNFLEIAMQAPDDIIRVCNGDCCSESSLLAELTGSPNVANQMYQSIGTNTLTVEMETDGSISSRGFRASYASISYTESGFFCQATTNREGVNIKYFQFTVGKFEVGTHGDIPMGNVIEALTDTMGSETDNSSCSGDISSVKWYYPNGASVAFAVGELPDGQLYRQQGSTQSVWLQRVVTEANITPAANGIYRCEISDENGVIQTRYVGLYTETTDSPNGVGVISISEGPDFSLISDIPLEFNLTSITTGGPPTIADWTLPNGITISPTSQTILDYESSTVIHTLTMTEELPGEYTFTTTNRRSVTLISSIAVQAANPPSGLMAVQSGANSVNVSWTAPAPGGATRTGYRIFFETDDSEESVDVGASATSHTITDLESGETYVISIVALSAIFTSDMVGPAMVTIEGTAPLGPVDSVVVLVDTAAITIAWNQPLSPNGVIQGYDIEYCDEDSTNLVDVPHGVRDPLDRPLNRVNRETSKVLTGLKPDTEYNITITPYTLNRGNLTSFTTTTLSIPRVPGYNAVRAVNTTAVKVSWFAVNVAHVDDLYYKLRHHISSRLSDSSTRVISGMTSAVVSFGSPEVAQLEHTFSVAVAYKIEGEEFEGEFSVIPQQSGYNVAICYSDDEGSSGRNTPV